MVSTPEVLEGTWAEIVQQADRLDGHRLRVVILPNEEPGLPEPPNGTLTLLDELDAEDENASAEDIARGKQEWESFREGINANRSAAGARIIYP